MTYSVQSFPYLHCTVYYSPVPVMIHTRPAGDAAVFFFLFFLFFAASEQVNLIQTSCEEPDIRQVKRPTVQRYLGIQGLQQGGLLVLKVSGRIAKNMY